MDVIRGASSCEGCHRFCFWEMVKEASRWVNGHLCIAPSLSHSCVYLPYFSNHSKCHHHTRCFPGRISPCHLRCSSMYSFMDEEGERYLLCLATAEPWFHCAGILSCSHVSQIFLLVTSRVLAIHCHLEINSCLIALPRVLLLTWRFLWGEDGEGKNKPHNCALNQLVYPVCDSSFKLFPLCNACLHLFICF